MRYRTFYGVSVLGTIGAAPKIWIFGVAWGREPAIERVSEIKTAIYLEVLSVLGFNFDNREYVQNLF